jgi:hypothetical protein
MFTDPMSVTVNAVAQTLNRVGTGANSSSYRTDNGLYRATISHSYGKSSAQRLIRLNRTTLVGDPLTTGNFLNADESIWLVSKTPTGGLVNNATQKQLVDGFLAYMSASSGANVTKLLAGEI